jgi:hypothetical protein
MEIDSDDVDFIIDNYTKQRMAKEIQRMRGEFSPNFQHMERYLKNERFDDQISLNSYQQKSITKSDQSDAALRQYLTGGHGEGVENATSDEEGIATQLAQLSSKSGIARSLMTSQRRSL